MKRRIVGGGDGLGCRQHRLGQRAAARLRVHWLRGCGGARNSHGPTEAAAGKRTLRFAQGFRKRWEPGGPRGRQESTVLRDASTRDYRRLGGGLTGHSRKEA